MFILFLFYYLFYFYLLFQYLILAPWVVHSIYSLIIKDGKERDPVYVLFFLFLLWRTLHNQIWISLSRYRTAKGNNRIVDKSNKFEQVDRESNWSVRNSLSHTQADDLHAWIFTFSCGVLFAGMTKYCWMGSFSTWVTWYFLGLLTCPYGEQMVYFLQFFFIWGLLSSYTTGYTEHCTIIIFTHAIILITIPRLSQSPSPVWIDHLLFDPLLINHYLH